MLRVVLAFKTFTTFFSDLMRLLQSVRFPLDAGEEVEERHAGRDMQGGRKEGPGAGQLLVRVQADEKLEEHLSSREVSLD